MALILMGRQSVGLQSLCAWSSCPSACLGDAETTVLVETTGTECRATEVNATCEKAIQVSTLDATSAQLLDKSIAVEHPARSSCPSVCLGDAETTALVETTGTERRATKVSATCEKAIQVPTLEATSSHLLDRSIAIEHRDLVTMPSEPVDVIVSFLSGNSMLITAELAWTGLQLSRELEKALAPGKAVQALLQGDQVLSDLASLGSGSVNAGEQLRLFAVIGCLEDTKLKQKGYVATDLRLRGYTAARLHAAGYSIQELRQADYSVKELCTAGFSLSQLTQAGYSAKELRTAGYSAKEMRSTFAWSASVLHSAGYSWLELHQCGFALRQHQQTSCLIEERIASGSMLSQQKIALGAIAC